MGGLCRKSCAKQLISIFFSLSEANALLPHIQSRISLILQLNLKMKAAIVLIQAAGISVDLNPQKLLNQPHTPDIIDALSDVCLFMPAVQALIDEISEKGVVSEDLEQGIFSWPAQLNHQAIVWCWRLGEPQIMYWRMPDEPFDLRHEIDTLCLDHISV